MRSISLAAVLFLAAASPLNAADKPTFPFRQGDRVVWCGSSSTAIGVWPKTMEFLLRTRHPDLNLAFQRIGVGGTTFADVIKSYDQWLVTRKVDPTIVVFNFGGNDANKGEKGLPDFRANIKAAVEKATAHGARVAFTTHQAADVRKAGAGPTANRKRYAEELLSFAAENNWPVFDVFHPLERLQTEGQAVDESFTILKDKIHLTDTAYVAWGVFLYRAMNPPPASSSVTLTADGKVTAMDRCTVENVRSTPDGLTFDRLDAVVPVLPPILPVRKLTPLEEVSDYRLAVTGLPAGDYEIRSGDVVLGVVSGEKLAAGVNLNSLILDGDVEPPWAEMAANWWAGKDLDRIGKTRWRFEVRKK